MLIVFRILLGICGGPLIPVSQALLVRLVPTRHSAVALTVWAMGSVLAPVSGPVIGGLIGDNMYWGWAFYFKVPLALGIAVIAWTVLRSHETAAVESKVDFVGLTLLVVWVGALQIMLGNGQDMDWFHSDVIVALLVITVLGLVCFVAWEITALRPIVNLQILRNRVFWVSVVVIGISFSCMSGSIVLLPMWLQSGMGYTATWAGYNMAVMGITMLATAPVAGFLISRFDTRVIVFIGLLIAAASDLMRIGYTDQVTFWQLMWPQLVFGIGMVLTMVPLIEMSTSALPDRDIPSGSGQFNFVRTLGNALATAVVIAFWNNEIRSAKAALVGALQNSGATMDNAQQLGMTAEQARGVVDQVVSGQSVMQATNTTFMLLGIFTVAAACFIWLSPKPPKRTGGAAPAVH
jgi:DHA2 family multidrug resistance protein